MGGNGGGFFWSPSGEGVCFLVAILCWKTWEKCAFCFGEIEKSWTQEVPKSDGDLEN